MRSWFPVARLSLVVAAALAAGDAFAQAAPPPASPAQQPAPPAATPPGSAAAAPQVPADPAVQEAVRRELEKAKQELRDEVRAEIQGQQAAKDFLQGADGEERKLEFFELDGYLRVRSDLLNRLDLSRGADPRGFHPYLRPLINPESHGTLTNVNMRLRLEPTMNVSEEIRIHAQVDVLDNLVLGSTPDTLFQQAAPTPVPLDARTQVPSDRTGDRDSIRVKRAWAEVQTPVGLLSFGRQRASWGVGILEHAGEGLDDDFGDSVDRLQFAIPLRSTPIGAVTVVPYYDLVATGLAGPANLGAAGVGQPVDREQADDATAIGFKLVHVETDEERTLKLDQGLSSWNWGLYYSYRSQGYAFPQYDAGVSTTEPGPAVRRDASAHLLDLWGRWQRRRLKLEWEGVAIVGEIGNAAGVTAATGETPAQPQSPFGPVLIRQYGAVARGALGATSRLQLGGELGVASGDRAPGMGNRPGRGYGVPGVIDGLQYGAAGDRDFRNFQFNPAYRVDMILWREILGAVTDAWYLKPSLEYTILDGLTAHAAIIYSQALRRESTPSGVHRSLGLEGDVGLRYASDDGFHAWLAWGVLQPLDGWNGAGDTGRAHAIRTGLAVKF